MPLQSYKELIVWQKAVELVVAVYALTDKFPREEMYGLVSQMHWAAVLLEEVQKILNVFIRKLKTSVHGARLPDGQGSASHGKIQKLKTCGGFTLVELLIVIAIMVVISTASVGMFVRYRNSQNLKFSTIEVATAVRDANKRSVTQEDGKQWAIRLSNTTSSQQFKVWGGTSFASATIASTASLRNGIQFGNPSTSSTLDLIFSAITGALSGNTVVTLNNGGEDGLVGDIIVTALGKVSTRNDSGLVGYWHLDENTSSTAYDATGYGNSGILQSSPTWTSGSNCKAGYCLTLNGSSQYVNAGATSTLNLAGGVSVTAWVRPNSTSRQAVVAMGNGDDYTNDYQIFIDTGAYFSVGEGSSATYAMKTSSISSGNWYYLVGTFDGTTAKLYINGTLEGQDIFIGTRQSGGSFRIGARDSSGLPEQYFNGSIDEVRVYNRALSATEIENQYNDLK